MAIQQTFTVWSGEVVAVRCLRCRVLGALLAAGFLVGLGFAGYSTYRILYAYPLTFTQKVCKAHGEEGYWFFFCEATYRQLTSGAQGTHYRETEHVKKYYETAR